MKLVFFLGGVYVGMIMGTPLKEKIMAILSSFFTYFKG
jgi:hypothetical protein